jgi:hypothetical protein
MISVTLSNTQSVLIFSAFCIAAITVIVALFRMNKVRADGEYKGARLTLEACNQKSNRRARKGLHSKPSQQMRVQLAAEKQGTTKAKIAKAAVNRTLVAGHTASPN